MSDVRPWPSRANQHLWRNPLLYRVQFLHPDRQPTFQLSDLIPRENARLDPSNLCLLVDLVERAPDQFQAGPIMRGECPVSQTANI